MENHLSFFGSFCFGQQRFIFGYRIANRQGSRVAIKCDQLVGDAAEILLASTLTATIAVAGTPWGSVDSFSG